MSRKLPFNGHFLAVRYAEIKSLCRMSAMRRELTFYQESKFTLFASKPVHKSHYRLSGQRQLHR